MYPAISFFLIILLTQFMPFLTFFPRISHLFSPHQISYESLTTHYSLLTSITVGLMPFLVTWLISFLVTRLPVSPIILPSLPFFTNHNFTFHF